MIKIGSIVQCLSSRVNLLLNKKGTVVSISLSGNQDYPIKVEFDNPYYPNTKYKIIHSYNQHELKLIK